MSGIVEILIFGTATLVGGLIKKYADDKAEAEAAEAMRGAQNAANARREALNKKLEGENAGLNTEMRQVASEQNRRLREQTANFDGNVSELKAQMERNRQSLQEAIDNVQKSLQAKEDSHRKQAEFWIGQIEAFFTDIEQYRHSLFTPNQLQKLKDLLTQISQDMRSEAFQAAISSSRHVFNQAAELKDVVVSAEFEWNFYYKKLLEALADTRSNLNHRKGMTFTFPTEEGDETVDAKINYWTDNELDRIEERLSQIEGEAAQPDGLPTDRLKEMTIGLQQINTDMELAEGKAKKALISSQYRAVMASKIGETFVSRGWTCKEGDCAYEGGEYNGKVHAKFSDVKGNEIVVVISPDENMENSVEVNFFNKDNDEGFRKMHLASILKSLKEDGLNVGEPVCRKGYEAKCSDNDAIRDVQATARKKAQATKS